MYIYLYLVTVQSSAISYIHNILYISGGSKVIIYFRLTVKSFCYRYMNVVNVNML